MQLKTDPPWFVPLVEGADHPARLLVLPQVGAGCAAMAEQAALFEPGIALHGLSLPGRQARFAEPPRTDLEPLAAEITAGMAPYTDRPYALFGYCSGALLAYLVAQRLHGTDLPPPNALIVASYPAPQLATPRTDLHQLPVEEFWPEIISYGGVPRVVAEQPDFREVFEPALRADYQLLAGFRYTEAEPLQIPITVLAGRNDPVLRLPELTAWSERTSGRFTLHLINGGHWLLDSAPTQVCELLASGWSA